MEVKENDNIEGETKMNDNIDNIEGEMKRNKRSESNEREMKRNERGIKRNETTGN
jgi:hypothetical protein